MFRDLYILEKLRDLEAERRPSSLARGLAAAPVRRRPSRIQTIGRRLRRLGETLERWGTPASEESTELGGESRRALRGSADQQAR